MRQCPLKYKECPLKRSLSGRVVHSFEIQVAKAKEGLCGGEYAAGLVSKKLRNELNLGLEMIPKK